MNEIKGPLDRMLYGWLRRGKPATHRGKGGLQFGFQPGRLTISRKGETPPSRQEAIVVFNSLRRALQAAFFLSEVPAVDTSDLTRWPQYEALGYTFTWETINEESTRKPA